MKSELKENYEEKMTFVFPLINFQMERKRISIDSGLEIGLLDDYERQYLREHRGVIDITRPWFPRYCVHIIEEDIVPAVKKVYPVISALRLLKPHLIGINGLIELDGPPEVYRFPGLLEVDTSSCRINKGIFSTSE